MSRIPDDAPVYSMAVAEKMTGLTRRRIRYYESMGLLEPARTSGNRRLYSPADIHRLLEVKRLLDEGLELRALAALAASGRWPAPVRAESPGERGRSAASLEVEGLGPYEDARVRFGRGPAGSVDRLYPGDAGRLVGGQGLTVTGPSSRATRASGGRKTGERPALGLTPPGFPQRTRLSYPGSSVEGRAAKPDSEPDGGRSK